MPVNQQILLDNRPAGSAFAALAKARGCRVGGMVLDAVLLRPKPFWACSRARTLASSWSN